MNAEISIIQYRVKPEQLSFPENSWQFLDALDRAQHHIRNSFKLQ